MFTWGKTQLGKRTVQVQAAARARKIPLWDKSSQVKKEWCKFVPLNMCVSTVPNKDCFPGPSSSIVKLNNWLGLLWQQRLTCPQDLQWGSREGKKCRLMGSPPHLPTFFSTVLKSLHCKHAASAGLIQSGGCWIPAPILWRLSGRKGASTQGWGSRMSMLQWDLPALPTSERKMKKAKTMEDRAGRALFLPAPSKEGEMAPSHLPQDRERLQEEPCAGLDLTHPGHQPLLKFPWFVLFPSLRMQQLWGSCHTPKATCLIC